MRGPLFHLIDSSVWIPYVRRSPPIRIRARVDEILDKRSAVLAGVVLEEVLGGARDDGEWEKMADAFLALEVLPTPPDAWWDAARLRYRLRRKGVTVPLGDILMATLAIRKDCTLLHADRHFDVIARHSRLRAERVG